MLHGLLVMERKSMPGDVYREIGEIQNNDEDGQEEQSLNEAIFGGSLSKIADARDQTKMECGDEHREADENREEIESVAGARVGHRFFVAIVGKSVTLDFVGRGWLRGLTGRLHLPGRSGADGGRLLDRNRARGQQGSGRQ